jgi:thiamine biosynthesis lipoprotein
MRALGRVRSSELGFDAMGTDCRIVAYGEVDPVVLEHARDRVMGIHRQMTCFEPGGDVWRANHANGAWTHVSVDLMRVLGIAADVSRLTGGAFDVTCRPLFLLWERCRREGRTPDASELASLVSDPDAPSLDLDERDGRVRLRGRAALDLGGIAKGYAADEVCRVLCEAGVDDALVDLGGSVSVVGEGPSGDGFVVGVQDPFGSRGKLAARLRVSGGACVVTSGVNERFVVRDGRRISHVIDPRTGCASEAGLASVTVVGTRATEADALATAMLAAGAEAAVAWSRERDVDVLLVTDAGEVLATEGARGRLVSG